ncbi:hypothetical protein RQ832_18980, partial [Roseomonas sp. DSM 102946]|nr:hypothetical protein [Roseomonas sp. DSM 102946]
TNIGAAPYTHTPALSHTALCESLFRLSPDYAEEFRLSGNPLFALIAISVWPRTKPLPEAIYGYLQEACRKIGATAYDVAAGRTKPGNAPKKVLEAFALAGRQGRSASAFADFKLHMEGLAVSERVDMSDEKSDAILHDIGQEYAAENRSGGSRSQLHRKLKRGREAGEAEPVRKPRVRVRRKPGVL